MSYCFSNSRPAYNIEEEMKIEVNDKISLDGMHDEDIDEHINNQYTTVEIGGERATVRIDVLISALKTMELRND